MILLQGPHRDRPVEHAHVGQALGEAREVEDAAVARAAQALRWRTRCCGVRERDGEGGIRKGGGTGGFRVRNEYE